MAEPPSSSRPGALLVKLLKILISHQEFERKQFFFKKPYLSGYHLRENLKLQQDVKADISLQARTTNQSNVYNKPNRIAQFQPVFLRLAFMTFYPTLEINQLS